MVRLVFALRSNRWIANAGCFFASLGDLLRFRELRFWNFRNFRELVDKEIGIP